MHTARMSEWKNVEVFNEYLIFDISLSVWFYLIQKITNANKYVMGIISPQILVSFRGFQALFQ